MLYEEDNDAINAELSKQKAKYELGHNDSANSNIFNSDVTYNTAYMNQKGEKYKGRNSYTNFNETNDKINLQKGSFAHNLHPNIEVFVHSLIDKIQTLQDTQLDIHHVEIITDRVFHSLEKLKYEVREVKDYVQKIESRNQILEAKIDTLITQNEAMNIKHIHLQDMCERFFSFHLENKDVNTQEKPKTPDTKNNIKTEQSYIKPSIEHTKTTMVQESGLVNINSNIEESKTENIKDLIKSKNQIETFIKRNYPDDYLKIKQYNKVNIFSWVNRVLGFN